MTIDIRAELLAALATPEAAAALRGVIAPIIRDEVQAARSADPMLSYAQAADHLTMSYAAFKTAASRDPELAALALGTGRMRRFRRSELELWHQKRTPRKWTAKAPG